MRLNTSTLPSFSALIVAAGFLASAAQAASYQPKPNARELQGVPVHVASSQSVQKSVASAATEKSAALRFAVDVGMPLNLADGVWDSPEAGIARWRSEVISVGAKSLSFEFGEFSLPVGAELWIYDVNGEVLQGPYTHANETHEGKLWTAIVPSDAVVMELRLPERQKASVGLALEKVHHGTISFAKMGEAAAKSGSCNVDAICSQADGWSNERSSVALLTIANNFLCTGELVNNVRADGRPLLLTANHCQAGTNASSVISYWNYQTSICGGTPNGSLAQNLTGATNLAGDVNADFTLLQLNQKPNSAWNVYYAGWNASSAIPQSGVAFHHPQGGEKRVSVYNTAATRAPVYINGNLVQAWAVKWAQGITESGSSGSALYNESHQIVGTLSGGEASCANPGGTDYFARLENAWTAQPASTGQLKAHLDPDNTGTLVLNGKSASSASSTPVTVPTVPVEVPSTPSSSPSAPAPVSTAAASGSGGGGGAFGLNLLGLLATAFAARKRLARRSAAA